MDRKKRVSCVIVNYNDADTTEKLVRQIFRYRSLDGVVVVDNGSTDGSEGRLRALAKELTGEGAEKSAPPEPDGKNAGECVGGSGGGRIGDMGSGSLQKPDRTEEPQKAEGRRPIVVLAAGKNGGYGAGNNLGIRYSCQELGMDHVLVANPDVAFSERTVARLSRLLDRHPELGAVSTRMQDAVYGEQPNGWPLLGLWGDLARSGPVCRRLFKPFLEYRKTYLQGKRAVYVDAVHGSLVMVDGKKFLACGGYDERVFLYNEEAILGFRLRAKGYGTALLLTDQYLHQHSQSISKTYGDMWQRQQLRNASALYYYKNYLKISRWQELAVKAFFQVVRAEIWCAAVWKEIARILERKDLFVAERADEDRCIS